LTNLTAQALSIVSESNNPILKQVLITPFSADSVALTL
jgi:hypothetical protein